MDGSLNGKLVSDRLFQWLEHTGELSSRIAEHEGISPTTVSNLLNARIDHPRLNTVRKIARHFGVSVDGFLVGPKAQAHISAEAPPLPPSGEVAESPPVEHFLQEAGRLTNLFALSDKEWYESAPDPEKEPEKAIQRGRDMQDDWRKLEPRLRAAIELERQLYPDTGLTCLPTSRLYQRLWYRYYFEASKAARKALEGTNDPTDGGRFPPINSPQPPEPIYENEARYVLWAGVEETLPELIPIG